ncbi:MAG: isochorismatase family cysteine hydrolase [Anaerolineales bacterium]
MKSIYFTSTQIEAQAEVLLSQVSRRNITGASWGKPALLVLDMQRYFLDPESHAFIPSAPAIVPGLLNLIRKFQKADYPVIYTRHLNSGEDAGNMSVWWRDLLTTEHPYSGLVEELKPFEDAAIQKPQYDAFFGTRLKEMLKSRQVTDVVITGVMTHLCCETTARTAFVRGYRVWFPVDGTATYNVDFHLGTLRALAHGFAAIPLVRDLVGMAL